MVIKSFTKTVAVIVLASTSGLAAADYPFEAEGTDWLTELPAYDTVTVASVSDINSINEAAPAASGSVKEISIDEEFPLAE